MKKSKIVTVNAGNIDEYGFGTFGIVLNGELLSYHYLTKKQFHKRLAET